MPATPEQINLPRFPAEVEAEGAYSKWATTDPFPDVPAALLNSSDLVNYVATAGVLTPYEIPPEKVDVWLKPASCAIPCTGEVLQFKYDETKQKTPIEPTRYAVGPKQPLVLERNSITYLHLGTTFRLPIYLAARFNLAIREIHRGILVGTGPLVDPGYQGQLFIPLHNLTDNIYLIQHQEPVVWVEFTKLSTSSLWDRRDNADRVDAPIDFPGRKLSRKSADDYLNHANQGRAIMSSIPPEISRAKGTARRALRNVTLLRRAGYVTLAFGLIGAVWPIVGLISDTNARLDRVDAVQERTTDRIQQFRERIEDGREAGPALRDGRR